MSDGLYLGLLIYLAILVSGAFLYRLSRDKRLPPPPSSPRTLPS